MRAFKIWNKNKTSSFDLSGLNVITSNVAGLGNKFTNELYDGRIKKHLINQHNSFEQISLTVNFGVNSNAYQKYREFMNFIQANGRNILVIEYYTPGASRFVDVALSNASKSQKTGFGVLVETVTFERLTPYYIQYRRTGTSILVSNNYMENVMPKITMSGRTYPIGTKIRVKSKNEGMPNLIGATDLGGGNYRLYNGNGITIDYDVFNGIYTFNGTWTGSTGGNAVIPLSNVNGLTLTTSVKIVSGVLPIGTYYRPSALAAYQIDEFEGVAYKVPYDKNQDFIRMANGAVFNNFQFKLQLEKAGNNLELDRARDEFNGKTLREVFEFSINHPLTTTYWGGNGGSIVNTPNGLLFTSSSDGNNHGIYSNPSVLTTGRVYYMGISGDNLKYPNLTGIQSNFDSSPVVNNRVSAVSTMTDTRAIIFYQSMTVGEQIEYTDFKLVDMTGLGIQNLTKEQMDYWFNIYQTLKETPTEYSKPITNTREIELNETILSNQELIIDSENKIVTLNGVNAYQITNKDKSTFLNLPEGDYLVECDTPIAVEYKRWVID